MSEHPQSQPDFPEIYQEIEILEAGHQRLNRVTVQRVPSYNKVEEVPFTLFEAELYKGATVGDIKVFEDKLRDEQGIERVANFKTVRKNTVLHVAASFGKLEIVKLVHEKCPSLVMRTNIRQDTALHLAARDGNSNLVSFFIENFKGDTEQGLLKMKNVDGNTALHEATINGHEEVAQLLSEQDQELANFVNNVGESPFYLAAEAGLTNLVRELLLKRTADHMIQEGHEGKSALHAAIAQQHTDTVKILLEHKAELKESRDNCGRSPLHYAAYCGYHQAIAFLLQDGVSIAHCRDKDGMSPIHLASINGHLNVFQELIKQCPDSAESFNNKFQNALHVACESGRVNMVTFMLETPELEKLINERDEDGYTPLHLATTHGHATIVSLLVRDKRVDLTIRNNNGLTAYEVAQTRPTSFQEVLCAVVLKFASAPNLKRRRLPLFKRHVQDTAADEKTPLENLRERISTLVLVATLIITITFAVGLVVPGGGDGGKEKTSQLLNCAFHVYVICNTIAMYSSVAVAVMLIWGHLGNPHLLDFALRWSMRILALALTMLAVAFAAGVCLVVRKFVWLARAVLVMSSIFLLWILVLFLPLRIRAVARYRWMGFTSKITSYFSVVRYWIIERVIFCRAGPEISEALSKTQNEALRS